MICIIVIVSLIYTVVDSEKIILNKFMPDERWLTPSNVNSSQDDDTLGR
jgi:hypothetical protein